jgi:DNA-binding PadR family transcriptional regulator
MQREGLIRVCEKTALKGKPIRKYYELTDTGQQCLLKRTSFLQDVVHTLS